VSEGRLASEIDVYSGTSSSQTQQMRKVTIMVPDDKMALLEELVKAIFDMEIVEVKEVDSIEEFQRKSPMERFDFALSAIVTEKGVIIKRYDFAWIYSVVQEGSVKDIDMFSSVKSFRQHLFNIGIDNVPSNSTISDRLAHKRNRFPSWEFSDCDITEAQRRINVVKRLLCLYNKGK
jgi:ASC-1-like (ASCH) protein